MFGPRVCWCSLQATRGFELEGKTQITSDLNLIFGFAHLDTRVTRDNVSPITGVSFLGNRLVNVPDNAVSLFLDYAPSP